MRKANKEGKRDKEVEDGTGHRCSKTEAKEKLRREGTRRERKQEFNLDVQVLLHI